MKKIIIKLIDGFYFPFLRKWFPYPLFRYAACGGGNILLDIFLYAVTYNFILGKQYLDLGLVVISPEVAALLIVTPITFLTGFWLMNHVAFEGSPIKSHTKLFRYLQVYAVNLLINYIAIKIFVDQLHFYPTPTRVIGTAITLLVSFLSQKYYTFRKARTVHHNEREN